MSSKHKDRLKVETLATGTILEITWHSGQQSRQYIVIHGRLWPLREWLEYWATQGQLTYVKRTRKVHSSYRHAQA